MASGTTIRSRSDSASAAASARLNIVLISRLTPTAIAFAREGLGSAILPSSELPGYPFVAPPQYELVDPSIQREIALMHLRSTELTPPAQAFASFTQDSFDSP